jgi:hypothetical protein
LVIIGLTWVLSEMLATPRIKIYRYGYIIVNIISNEVFLVKNINEIKDILNIIKTIIDIMINLKPLIISAWTKIKNYFDERKKNYVAIN